MYWFCTNKNICLFLKYFILLFFGCLFTPSIGDRPAYDNFVDGRFE